MFCFLGFILFLYFAYHETLNFVWDEYVYSLNYIAGIAAIGGLFYYMFERVEILGKAIIYAVAWKSVWVLNAFGFEAGLGQFGYLDGTNELGLAVTGSRIGIILACTGIQSIAIFVGILVVTKSNRELWVPWSKKFIDKEIPEDIQASRLRSWLWVRKQERVKKVIDMSDRTRFFRSFMYTIPIIYVLNIFRNVLIIWGTHHEVLGPDTFDIAHNQLSKYLSLGVLIIMIYILFELLPEFMEGIMGLLDLPKRTHKGMVKDGLIEAEESEDEQVLSEKSEKKKIDHNPIKDKVIETKSKQKAKKVVK
jgi:exosortase/archaeosortase family protein